MKYYVKPSGIYVELSDTTPVSPLFTEVTQRPSEDYDWNDGWVLNLSRVKSKKQSELISAYAGAVSGGFESSALGSAHFYDTDTVSLIKLVGATACDDSVSYECTDTGTGVKAMTSHTAAQMKQVMRDAKAKGEEYKLKLTQRLASLSAASTLAEVEAVAW